jgi:hypothetical protein
VAKRTGAVPALARAEALPPAKRSDASSKVKRVRATRSKANGAVRS